MASVSSSLCFQSLGRRTPPCNSIPYNNSKGMRNCRNQSIVQCSLRTTHNSGNCIEEEEQSKNTKRREALIQIATLAAFSYSPFIGSAAAAEEKDNFRVYSDETNKYKIMVPEGDSEWLPNEEQSSKPIIGTATLRVDWQVGQGKNNGLRALTGFYPQIASESNVSVFITLLGADFTRMESFGKVEEFAETLVSGLDRSWQNPPGAAAKLVACKSSNGFYNIEYTLQKPGESCRHIFSKIGMANNGYYNRLFTVTGQFMEEETDKYSSNVQKTVSSFKFT
ncbi:hypothetical protein C5167_038741 [Papaver somniferum]|uniref:PsbP C-terminal domain-containing protein n=1 Tax=Papaver somniferum TaxID=3469 RepID=A0A4Y7IDH0_PAPSO|nr:hypothetical protein C5167_038741 [Papaver somniferum]